MEKKKHGLRDVENDIDLVPTLFCKEQDTIEDEFNLGQKFR